MARILCNVAGGGKPLKGNAETGDVLAGKTFSNKQSNALTGSMPNNGAWSASTSGSGSVTIPAGYHNGRGTVSGATSYSNGYSNGVSAADGRVNTSSASYNSGYSNGVSAADARVNTSSASYNSGYANGYNAGGAVGHSANLRVTVCHTGSGDVECHVYLNNGQIGAWHQNANGTTKDAFNRTITI